jgi:hypothetical protein
MDSHHRTMEGIRVNSIIWCRINSSSISRIAMGLTSSTKDIMVGNSMTTSIKCYREILNLRTLSMRTVLNRGIQITTSSNKWDHSRRVDRSNTVHPISSIVSSSEVKKLHFRKIVE